MTCNKCGGGALTPYMAWVNGGYQAGYLVCETCGNRQPTTETAAALRAEAREERAETAAAEEAEAAAEEVTALLDGTIAELSDRLDDIDDGELLEAMSAAEAAGKNRAGALNAIQARIDALSVEKEAATNG